MQISRIRLSHGVFAAKHSQRNEADASSRPAWRFVLSLCSPDAEFFCRRWFCHQSALCLSEVGVTVPRPLRSTGITPLQRYYGPLRLLHGQPRRLLVPAPLRSGARAPSPPRRSPRFRVSLVLTRRPRYPGKSRHCLRSSLHGGCWLRPLWRVGHFRLLAFRGPSRFTVVAAHQLAFQRFERKVALAPAWSASCLMIVLHGDVSFLITRETRLCLAHQRNAENCVPKKVATHLVAASYTRSATTKSS